MLERASDHPKPDIGERRQRVCAVRRRRFPVGESPTRQSAPSGSYRSSRGGNETVEAFGMMLVTTEAQHRDPILGSRIAMRTIAAPTLTI